MVTFFQGHGIFEVEYLKNCCLKVCLFCLFTWGLMALLAQIGYRAVAPCVPPETEANPVQRLFCQLNLAFDGLLVMFRL